MTSSLGSSLFSFSIYSASSVAASKNEPVVPSLPPSHSSTWIVAASTPTSAYSISTVLLQLLGALLSVLLLLLHLHSYLSCLSFDTCTAISTVSASTPALPSLPFCFHLHCHLYTVCFCFQTSTSILYCFCYPNLHFRLYYFCSHTCTSSLLLLLTQTCTSISTVSDLTPALPSFLFLLPLVHYRLYYSTSTVLNFHVYYFCSHTSNFMSTTSAPTPTLPFSLFLHPHLTAIPYCFCFQTCTYVHVFRTAAPKPELQPLLLLPPPLYFHIHFFCSHNWTSFVIPLLSQHLYVFPSAFASTLTLHLCWLGAFYLFCAQYPNRKCTIIIGAYTFILTACICTFITTFLHHYSTCAFKFIHLFFIFICLQPPTSASTFSFPSSPHRLH